MAVFLCQLTASAKRIEPPKSVTATECFCTWQLLRTPQALPTTRALPPTNLSPKIANLTHLGETQRRIDLRKPRNQALGQRMDAPTVRPLVDDQRSAEQQSRVRKCLRRTGAHGWWSGRRKLRVQLA